MTTQTESNRVDSETPIAYLPLAYFDIPMLRIFVPISAAPVDSDITFSDTLVCEVKYSIYMERLKDPDMYFWSTL